VYCADGDGGGGGVCFSWEKAVKGIRNAEKMINKGFNTATSLDQEHVQTYTHSTTHGNGREVMFGGHHE
jgi:hypothetical protein